MRIFVISALVALAGNAVAGESASLAKRFDAADSVQALVQATKAFSTDISRACRAVRHVVPGLEARYGQDSVLDHAYISITSCCSVVDQANVLGVGNALAQIASPARSDLINLVYAKAVTPLHASIESQLTEARGAVSGHCAKVPALAAILSNGSR